LDSSCMRRVLRHSKLLQAYADQWMLLSGTFAHRHSGNGCGSINPIGILARHLHSAPHDPDQQSWWWTCMYVNSFIVVLICSWESFAGSMQIRMLTVLISSMSDHKEIYDINMLNILIVLLEWSTNGSPRGMCLDSQCHNLLCTIDLSSSIDLLPEHASRPSQ
jgi:hypothetical protein